MTTETNNIIDWFDIHDDDHLQAWSHLCTTGLWPKGFVPEGTRFDTNWQMLIEMKMANAWVSYSLGDGPIVG